MCSATLNLDIVGDDGRLVSCLDIGDSVPFELNGEHSFQLSWNTASTSPGLLSVRARLQRLANDVPDGSIIEVNSNLFAVRADKHIECTTQVDKPIYEPGDKVRLTTRLSNGSLNYVFPKLTISASVQTLQGAVVWRSRATQDLVQIGEERSVEFLWQPDAVFGAQMPVQVVVFEDSNGNGIPDSDEPQAASSDIIRYSSTNGFARLLDVTDALERHITYTSSPVVALRSQTAGDADLSTGALMMLSGARVELPGATGRNRALNPGFETTRPDSPSVPLFWHNATDGGLTLLELSTVDPWQGTRSMHITSDSSGRACSAGAHAGTTEPGFDVPPASDVTVSCWYHGSGASGESMRLVAVERDSAAAIVRSSPSLAVACSPSWQRAEFTCRTLANTSSMGVRIELAGAASNQSIWIDGLQIEDGRTATSWIDSARGAADGTNLLANPTLALDFGTSWILTHRLLEPQSNSICGDGLPDAWQWPLGIPSVARSSCSGLPYELVRCGVDSCLQVQTTATASALRQGLISVMPGTALAFSVYGQSASSASLTLVLHQYNAAGTELGPVESVPFALSGQWQRHSLLMTSGQDACSVACELRFASGSQAKVVAAQLEYATTATAWCGWTPYRSFVTPWSFGTETPEGIKRACIQILDATGRLSVNPSERLTLDDANSGGFASGCALGTYSVTATDAAGQQDVDGWTLFDGDAYSRPVLPSGATTVTVELEYVAGGAPVIDNLVLQVPGAAGDFVSVRVEGAFVPGEWMPVRESSVPADAAGRILLDDLDGQFDRYRLTISASPQTIERLAEFELRGHPWAGEARVVFDATPPQGVILQPDGSRPLGGATTTPVSVSVWDNLSGVAGGEYRVLQDGSERITWQEFEKPSSAMLTALLDLEQLSDGSAQLEVRIADRAGNQRLLPARILTVDRTPPHLDQARFVCNAVADAQWTRLGDNLQLSVHCDDAALSPVQVLADLRAFGLSGTEPAAAGVAGGILVDSHRTADVAVGRCDRGDRTRSR